MDGDDGDDHMAWRVVACASLQPDYGAFFRKKVERLKVGNIEIRLTTSENCCGKDSGFEPWRQHKNKRICSRSQLILLTVLTVRLEF